MNPAIDQSVSVEHVAPEIKLRCSPPQRDPGGGGINISRVIQRLGGDSQAIYPAGGPPGVILQQLLDAESLRCRVISTQHWTRENLTVFDEATEQQYRFGAPGPELAEHEWQQCLDAVATIEPKPDYVVASGSLPPGVPDDFYAQVARHVSEIGARFVLDTSGAPLRHGLRAGVFLTKPNMRELEQIVGSEIETEAQQETIIKDLIAHGSSEVIVVSLGAAGALLATEGECVRFRAPTVPIRSKVGAGDSMVGGIVLALARHRSIHEAIRYGVAAGSAAVMTPGTDLCHRDDVERLYEQTGMETT